MFETILTMQDVDLKDKRVLIREDFNVPMEAGSISSDQRIRAALPGIKYALEQGAQVLLMSHLGRPRAGKWEQEYSLKPVAERLEQLLNIPVTFIVDGLEPAAAHCKLVLYENVRFLSGETENDSQLAQQMAKLCDVFVMDAFGSAHRAHASTEGVAHYAPVAVAGPLLLREIIAIDQLLLDPEHPVVAILGGAKISDKINAVTALLDIADTLLIGGGMANTFLAAQGFNVGASLCEVDQIPQAKKLLELAPEKNCLIILPIDGVVADGTAKAISDIDATDKILDIGPRSTKEFIKEIEAARTILWNGPVGVFQEPMFAIASNEIAQTIANSDAYSIAGGGETISAIEEFNLTDDFSYISTGGGAFLEYLEGRSLPAILALTRKTRE